MPLNKKTRKLLTKLPHTCGVYLFLNSRGKIIYVGKAVDLKKRVQSYFRKQKPQDPLKSRMVQKTAKIKWQKTDSEIEALILEAALIKKHQPDFNVLLKDSSDYFYVGITQEKFPKIFITHQPKIQNTRYQIPDTKYQIPVFWGPFTDGTALKKTLQFIRKIFPFCTCRQFHKRPCLAAEMGQCLGVCCLTPELAAKQPNFKKDLRQYRENIDALKKIITGKKKKLISDLNREMKKAAAAENFEKAAILRDQIFNLQKIFFHKKVLFPRRLAPIWPEINKVIQKLLKVRRDFKRIEAYDISHISGKNAVGAMVVFKNGKASPDDYRRFKIKSAARRDDPAMMKEIIERRIRHQEWPLPNLILIDGGKPQLNAAEKILKFTNPEIPVLTLAKGKNELLYSRRFKKPRRLNSLPPELKLFLLRIRDQAHKFAIKYHRKLRRFQ